MILFQFKVDTVSLGGEYYIIEELTQIVKPSGRKNSAHHCSNMADHTFICLFVIGYLSTLIGKLCESQDFYLFGSLRYPEHLKFQA